MCMLIELSVYISKILSPTVLRFSASKNKILIDNKIECYIYLHSNVPNYFTLELQLIGIRTKLRFKHLYFELFLCKLRLMASLLEISVSSKFKQVRTEGNAYRNFIIVFIKKCDKISQT